MRAQRRIRTWQCVVLAASCQACSAKICHFAAPGNVGAPAADPSDLRAAFDTALRELVSQHPDEAPSKYPDLRGYLGAA